MRLSVIIPNYNGACFIDSLCHALEAQTMSSDTFEVIFVDNGSSDDSIALMQEHGRGLRNLKILSYTEQQGSYAARNFGVGHAEADLFVFADADCIPVPEWLAEIARIAKTLSGVFLIVGDVRLFPRGRDFNCYELYDKRAFLNQRQYAEQQTGATANLTVSRMGFESVGGFPEVFSGGDRVFSSWVMATDGAQFVFSEVAAVLHPARSTKAEIVKKVIRLGRGKATLHYKLDQPAANFRFLTVQIIGFILLPNQWRMSIGMFREYGLTDARAWAFLPMTLRFGWVQRLFLIARFIALMRGRTHLRDE